MKNENKKEVEFNNGRVERHFTKEWLDSGMIKQDAIPKLVASLVTRQVEMTEYIEALHDKIDWILEKNNCCDMPGCLTANCGSDHK